MVIILLHYFGNKILFIEEKFLNFPTAMELRNKIMIQTYEKVNYDMGKSAVAKNLK